MEIIKAVIHVAAMAIICYHVPYFIARGWAAGKNAVVSERKVCDVCWRDIHKVNEALKNK